MFTCSICWNRNQKAPTNFKITSWGHDVCWEPVTSVRAKQRSRNHRVRQGGAPEGVWDTEGRDSILSVTLNTDPLRPTHVSLSRRPWRQPVPAPGANREGPATPSGSGDGAQCIPDGEAGWQWERPWAGPWEDRGSGFCLRVPLHPAQPAWAERFPGSSRLPSTVWVFVLKLALNASPVLSQFTRVYSGSSVVLLTVFRLVNVYWALFLKGQGKRGSKE